MMQRLALSVLCALAVGGAAWSPRALLNGGATWSPRALLNLRGSSRKQDQEGPGNRDLVLMHIPFNFGHTIEQVAMFRQTFRKVRMGMLMQLQGGGMAGVGKGANWRTAERFKQPGGEIWGHFNPDLHQTSNITGCPLYYTPPKHWPRDIAEKYFGNKTVFGTLRDPYEHLVALFRGNMSDYGGSYPEFFKSCDVNGAVKQMMKDYIAGKNIYAKGCTLVPQAEYYDQPFGVTLPVDNREFPVSMNRVFREHGYPETFQIRTRDVLHVTGCPNSWAADLDNETRAMVRQVYARDFELLCKHFGYCDQEENACLHHIPDMCPESVRAQMREAQIKRGNYMAE